MLLALQVPLLAPDFPAAVAPAIRAADTAGENTAEDTAFAVHSRHTAYNPDTAAETEDKEETAEDTE